jgi:hypothetical protein
MFLQLSEYQVLTEDQFRLAKVSALESSRDHRGRPIHPWVAEPIDHAQVQKVAVEVFHSSIVGRVDSRAGASLQN